MKPDMPSAAAPPRDDVHTAAKQLEAFFLRRLLAEARPQGASLDGGFAGDTFKQMLDEAVADKVAAAGGIGLAALIGDQLANGLPPPSTSPAPLLVPPSSHAPSSQGTHAFLLPVAGRPTSGYGLRRDPLHAGAVRHAGYDLAAKTGTPVIAAAAGTVVHAGPAGTYGNLVTIRHAGGLETRYAHLSTVGVETGAEVAAGAAIGAVGSTGRSTGPHLHFEIRRDGRPIDPALLLPLNSSSTRTNQ